MANVLPLSGNLSLSELATLSGNIYSTHLPTPFTFTGLAYTDPLNSTHIDYNNPTLKQNAYPVIPLSAKSVSTIWTVGTDIDSNTILSVYINSYLDHDLTLWMNVNGAKSTNNRRLCYNIAEVYEPTAGKHTKSSYTLIDLTSYNLNNGDRVYFYLGAGPRTAPSGGYWASTTITVSGNPGTNVASSPAPVRLSEYYHQDVDIPTKGSPIRLSNFLGAVNYLPNTLLSFYNVMPTNTREFLYRDASGRLHTWSGNSIDLGALNVDSIIRFKHSQDTNATNLSGFVSDTYAMVNAELDATLVCTDRENDADEDDTFYLFLQRNGESQYHISTTYLETQQTFHNPTLSRFLKYLNLDTQAPQVVAAIQGIALDAYLFKPTKNVSSEKYTFNFNANDLLQRLIAISNQTNPLVQFQLNTLDYNYYRNNDNHNYTGEFYVTRRVYTNQNSPVCDAYVISGPTSLKAILLNRYNVGFGDVINLYVGAVKGTNVTLNLRNTLLLDFN